jgi:LmbE family N-acetylglucosaminyl deacetylase
MIVFAPHPDDETLACGGTIAMSVTQGKEVYVVVMTDGRNSHKATLSIDKNPTPRDLIPIRRNESKRATRILGVRRDHLIFLDFEDGDLESHHQEAKEIVQRLLNRLRPSTIFTPDRSDLHPDHSSTGAIVSDAVRASMLSPLIYTYVVWGENEFRATEASSGVDFDISRYLTIKRAAIREYKSQFTRLFKSQSRPIIGRSMLSRFMRPSERFTVTSPAGST